MNRAVARCWQACSPDKRPILSHRQMTHRQAPKTKQTCLGFGQGLPESRTLRTLSSSPTGGQVAVFRLFLVLVNQGLHPPCPLRFAQRIDGAPSGARPVVPDALAWQGHGREGARGARGPGQGTDGRGPGEGRGPWRGARRRPTGRRRATRARPGATILSALCSCPFGLRLPTSGAVVLWGLHIVPPARGDIHLPPW